MPLVDLGASRNEGNFIESMLKRRGLALDISGAIAFLASTIRDHKHLETLLTSCDGEERQMLYEGVKPHLRFPAKPLDWYVSRAGQRAEAEQWPTLAENGEFCEFKPACDVSTIEKHAQEAIAADLANRTLTLTCSKCTRQQSFVGVEKETPADVILKARKAGWVHDYLATPAREICPKCPTSLRPNA